MPDHVELRSVGSQTLVKFTPSWVRMDGLSIATRHIRVRLLFIYSINNDSSPVAEKNLKEDLSKFCIGRNNRSIEVWSASKGCHPQLTHLSGSILIMSFGF